MVLALVFQMNMVLALTLLFALHIRLLSFYFSIDGMVDFVFNYWQVMDLKIYDALNILPTSFMANGNMVRAIGGPTVRLTANLCTHIERKLGLNPVYDMVMINDRAV